ncbi:MAG TPA: biotin/lipoyl-containing protein, partial [Roseiflexaceae bacterium]
RHQKIVEESPSPALTPELRAAMGADAVRLAQAAGYRNAGTVEFMLDEQGRTSDPGSRGDLVSRPYFLEMNTRLQVEHPITELVAGIDLVQLQIALAAGARLPFQQADLAQRGHGIEARVYAEDPATYLPATGRVALFAPPEGPGIRNDVGIQGGDEVTVHYDPMLAKLIVHAPDRAAAIARLRRALDDYTVLGVTTNLPLLRAIAAHPAFAAGATHTDFLATSGLTGATFEPQTPPTEVLTAAAIFDDRTGTIYRAPATDDPWRAGPWRLLRDGMRMRYLFGKTEHLVLMRQAAAGWHIEIGATTHAIGIVAQQIDQLALSFDGARIERFRITQDRSGLLIGWRGESFRLARAAALNMDSLGGRASGAQGHTSLDAPMPGTVIKVLAEEGQAVAARQPLIILEAMKMEHIVAAPYDGVVRKLLYSPGALVAKGATLVELDEI